MKTFCNFQENFKEAILKCSQCGFCQAECPVFSVTLRPSYNARGKIMVLKEIINGRIQLNQELAETLFQCTTCGKCAQNCPSGVNVPEIIKSVRRDMVLAGFSHPTFAGLSSALAAGINIYGEPASEEFIGKKNQKAEYVYFVGCVGQFREEESTTETLELFDRLNIDYTLIDEVCCTGVLEDLGYSVVEKHAKRNMERIFDTGAHTVITGCPFCARTFNNKAQYSALKNKGIKIVVLSQLLKDMDFGGVKTDKCVTYHDPCDLGRHGGIYEEPREVIRRIAPNFVELPHHHEQALCCGAGGGMRGAFSKTSISIARKRLEEVVEVGAQILLTDCNSCLHNLRNAKLRTQDFKVFNTTQFINKLMGDSI